MASFDQNTKSDGIIEKTVCVRRTAKVVKGGRKFNFLVVVVVGDGNGRVGVGKGKAGEVPQAMQKAFENARKNMVRVLLNGGTIHHSIMADHGASKVYMQPAGEGTGIIAGGAMRAVCEVLGVKNILAKCMGSTNPVNVVKATVKGFTQISTPEWIASKRGKTLEEIYALQSA